MSFLRKNSRLAVLRKWNRDLSLRVKGLLSLIVVVAYAILMTAVVTQERQKLPTIVSELDRLYQQDEQLVQLSMQAARAVMATGEMLYSDVGDERTKLLFVELAPLNTHIASAAKNHTALRGYQEVLLLAAKNLAHQPTRAVLLEMRASLHKLILEVDRERAGIRAGRQKLLNSFQLVHDRVTLETMFFLFLGVVIVGSVMTIFFTRLTWDIRRVGIRAMTIVKGYRGKALDVTRGDEVGGLMRAVNQMQLELRERERQLELVRQQQFHKEKMAAVGSLAAAVAHEINNPIMAISGLAQVLMDQSPASAADGNKKEATVPEMILEQSKRIAAITRQIFEFSSPQSPEPRLCDLNTLVQSTTSFVRFDQRYRQIDLRLNLNPNISAVVAVPDHLTQVLINLLLNAADAFENSQAAHPTVTVSTLQRNSSVEITVSDNGGGMTPETLARAFDEFFTTKPRGKGTGLGLFLCKSLVEKGGGQVEIGSVYGEGTDVIVRFPLPTSLE
jgi:signal transduction histidine kinase